MVQDGKDREDGFASRGHLRHCSKGAEADIDEEETQEK